MVSRSITSRQVQLDLRKPIRFTFIVNPEQSWSTLSWRLVIGHHYIFIVTILACKAAIEDLQVAVLIVFVDNLGKSVLLKFARSDLELNLFHDEPAHHTLCVVYCTCETAWISCKLRLDEADTHPREFTLDRLLDKETARCPDFSIHRVTRKSHCVKVQLPKSRLVGKRRLSVSAVELDVCCFFNVKHRASRDSIWRHLSAFKLKVIRFDISVDVYANYRCAVVLWDFENIEREPV